MSAEWYYQSEGKGIGPVSSSVLRQKASSGEVEPNSLVRRGRNGHWVRAQRVKGLFNAVEQSPASGNLPACPVTVRAPALVESSRAPAKSAVTDPTQITATPLPMANPRSAIEQHTSSAALSPTTRWKPGRLSWIIVGCVLIAAILFYSRMRHSALRDDLKRCETYGVVNADVYYDGMFSRSIVVFDLKDGGSHEARRIDPVHLLLQFCSKADLSSVSRVVLARDGREALYIDVIDLRSLTESYEGGGRVWAFNHLPESVRAISGERAYPEWTGGWLVVLQRQSDDLDHFIGEWTGY